jgi:hypothetical protein
MVELEEPRYRSRERVLDNADVYHLDEPIVFFREERKT